MNELTTRPSEQEESTQSNRQNSLNRLVMLIPLFYLLRGNNSTLTSGLNTNILGSISSLGDIVGSLNVKELINSINVRDVQHRVTVLKRVGPYLPETSIPVINRVILTVEKVNRIMSLLDFVSTARTFEPIAPVEVSNKERINKVFSVLNEEISDDRLKNVKPVVDVVTNMDKLKGAINSISSLGDPSKKSETSLVDIVELVLPLLGDRVNVNKDKVKEMVGMFEMMKILNESEDDDEE